MNTKEIYGRTISCECGKTHHIEPNEIIYSTDALNRIPVVLERYSRGSRVAVLMDSRTGTAAGEEAVKTLQNAGKDVIEINVPDPAEGKSPVCDDVTFHSLLDSLPEADIILPVGSGVINDLGKWIASERNLPWATFATAASMNGYTSANVAVTVKGLKTLERAHPPRAVLCDPRVLKDAPYELTASGLGDILAKSASSADWYMNHLLFGDYFCQRSVSLVADLEPLYMDRPEGVRDREPGALEALFHGLLLTGVAMTMAETSSPASGGEHLVSHTLDMMSSLDGHPHDLHGRQVGVGTILASAVYSRVIELESPEFRVPEGGVDPGFWGRLSGEISREYTGKRTRMEEACRILSKGVAWDDLRESLAPLVRPPEKIRDVLKRAGAAYRAGDLGCDRGRLFEAFVHAHEMRSRFTILDLAGLAGILPQAAPEIIEEWG